MPVPEQYVIIEEPELQQIEVQVEEEKDSDIK